ncbi:cache domain-containing protein [Desulfopila sp. IMCC35008]|uniref:cache domain-containing protein n=1 Tax=Desulfopila sp. IMCC35008 TaxID=2653858 RepID=UPI0013D61DA8|nr:cache domain-containing protein [Desulfopila sp. IMCC35008]
MKIRTKITLYLAPFILVTLIAIFLLNYHVVRSKLGENANLELVKIEENVYRSTVALLDSAISNYLRGITDKNLNYVERQYYAVLAGTQSKEKAVDKIQEYFNHQLIGMSGYMAAVKEQSDNIYLDLHPFLAGEDCTITEGCQAWAETRNGYTEYDWKNPNDDTFRKKAAYVREFPPWNWIIGASSYRDEFLKLVNIDDLRNLIQPIQINKSGYFIVFSDEGEVLIHPELEHLDEKNLINSEGRNVVDLLIEGAGKYITYKWKNPSEKKERLKYAFGQKLEGYNWYLIATGYVSEIYEPIKYFRELTIFLVLVAGCALAAIIFRVSRDISFPLYRMEEGINSFYARKEPFHWKEKNISEIDVLGSAFARMTQELNHSVQDLEEKNRELAESEEAKEGARHFLDSIINSMPSVIIGVDPSFVVTEWNRQAEKVTGFARDEAKGTLLYDLCDWLDPYREALEENLVANEVKVFPLTRIDERGATVYSELTVYPLVVSGYEGAVLRMDEVTDRVEMEQRLRQSQKMDAVGQLAGGVAHDFNNMLSGIIGSAELLSIKVGPEEQKLVRIITEASGRAGELIQKLLAFSRKAGMDFGPVDMHEIIESTVEILERSLDKKISIQKRLLAETVTVMGEWTQLQNSLLNIGINAGHAMENGGGELNFTTSTVVLDSVYCEMSPFALQPGRFLQVLIRDTGCGISNDNLKRIFEPFFTTRDQDKGTGLGLAAVYGAMQQHHGAVSVYSELNEGTEFSMLLPLAEGETAVSAKEQKLVPGTGCILIVDDEPVVRITARLMLEKIGYRVLEAEHGLEGVKVYQRHKREVDVVLLDMVMPVMDGTSCFYKLQEVNPDVRVVISSGFTRDADLGGLREKGLKGFVRKPFNMAELSEVLAEVLNLQPGKAIS